jgi:zinc/manganese transport system permease protein
MRISSSPLGVPLISVGFALVSVVGGILLALGSALPISPYVTTISFLIYAVCRVVGGRRARRRTAAKTSRRLVSQAG